MRSLSDILKLWSDPRMKETIRVLWREIHDNNVIEGIVQEAHGFLFGEAVKIDAISGSWIRTKADELKNAGTEGIVCRILNENTFNLRHGGFLAVDEENPFLPGVEYYLSPTDQGQLTVNLEQWPDGSVQEFIGRGIDGGLLLEIDRANHSDKHFRHTQKAPSRVWEVVHNLDKYPSVSISDAEGNEYESDVKHIDRNNTLLTFSEAFAGFADLN